jgi:hypothetical protein
MAESEAHGREMQAGGFKTADVPFAKRSIDQQYAYFLGNHAGSRAVGHRTCVNRTSDGMTIALLQSRAPPFRR